MGPLWSLLSVNGFCPRDFLALSLPFPWCQTCCLKLFMHVLAGWSDHSSTSIPSCSTQEQDWEMLHWLFQIVILLLELLLHRSESGKQKNPRKILKKILEFNIQKRVKNISVCSYSILCQVLPSLLSCATSHSQYWLSSPVHTLLYTFHST